MIPHAIHARRRRLGAALAAALALLVLGLPALGTAHGVDVSQLTQGPNGGLLSSSGETYIEVLAQPGVLNLWLTTHEGAAVDTSAMTASVTLHNSAGRVDLQLQPQGDHMLAARDPRIAPSPGTRISVQAVLPDGTPIAARLEVKAAP